MLGFDFALVSNYKRFQNDFVDLGKIGSGGFSKVHKVKSKFDQRQYALKIVQIKPSQCKEDILQILQKLVQETKVLSNLNHRNVIQYNGCWLECEPYLEAELEQMNRVEELQDQQFQMVIQDDYDQFSSGGIQFQFQSSKSGVKTNQKSRSCQNKQNQKKSKILIQQKIIDPFAQIKRKFKTISMYILTELCESNIQSYLYKRNSSKKQLSIECRNQKDQMLQNYKMIIQIIEGLEYLHSRKIIHRDIKLHNIVVDQNMKCKIIDFGLAKKVRLWNSIDDYSKVLKLNENEGEQLQEELFSTSVGTKIYSSPQQMHSEKYDHRTDIYSLAMVIIMFFCHFTTSHQELQLLQKIRKIELSQIQVDSRLKNLLTKCLGQQKIRPSLTELKSCIRLLLRQRHLKLSQKDQQNKLQRNSIIEEGEYAYLIQNGKLRKRISKDELVKDIQQKQILQREQSTHQLGQISVNVQA